MTAPSRRNPKSRTAQIPDPLYASKSGSVASVLVQVCTPFAQYADTSVIRFKFCYKYCQWPDSGVQTVSPGVAVGAVGLDGGIQVNGWAFAALVFVPKLIPFC